MAAMMFGAMRSPRNLVFGAGQRASLPRYARELGSHALVVTDERLAEDGQFKQMMAGLAEAGVRATIYSGTVAELPAACITDGLKVGQAAGVDLVIGIGGGSCMDAAKVIALLLSHGGQPSDYFGEFKVPGPITPLIAVPTTAGTGSEVTPVAVISDPEKAVKVGIASPHLIPTTSICDPELTYSCPPGLTAASGADALTHAIEAYTTLARDIGGDISHEHVFLGKNAISDQFALAAIGHIAASLKAACDNGDDRIARERLMYGAMLAGLAFGVAGTAAAHAVQYPVGALTHSPHGVGVAVMMPYVMAFNLDAATQPLAEIGVAMGVAGADMDARSAAMLAIEAVAKLFASIGIPENLAALGLAEDKLGWTAEAALGATRLVKNNPRPLDLASMTLLVECAFRGDRHALQNSESELKGELN
tara:strand:+ start:46542 stop:47804 length:1263 start_codon:yes stop_codon:yes gene_type:complete